ncbi:MAG: hypothetical protein ABI830_11720 [Pseudolabrys sp.]
MRNIAAVLFALVLLPSMAVAQSVASVLRDFGLIRGSWAPDCSKGPSTSNWYGIFQELPSGGARLTYKSKTGDSGDNVYVIWLARRLSDKEILLGQEFVREKRRLELVLHVDGDRYRTLSAKRENGDYQVKDGKYTNGGADSPWLNRCR